MNRKSLIATVSLSALVLAMALPAIAEAQSLAKEVYIETVVTEDSAQRTRSFAKELGNGQTASGSSVETLQVDDGGQVYTKDASRTTFGGQQLQGSITDEIRVEGDTATRDYARTVTNQTTGESITRTRNTEVVDTENGATWTRDDSISGNERSANSAVSGSVVQNDDGSATYQRDRTITNAQGEQATRSKSVNVAKDDAGNVSVDRQNDSTGFDGQSISRSRQSTVAQNEDGTGSISRTSSAVATGANGEGQSTTVTRAGRTTRDGEGSGTYESSRQRQNANGTGNRVDRSGSVQRNNGTTQRTRSRRRSR